MKFLITGGAGFIGSALVRHIVRETADSVVNVDKLTYAGNLAAVADVAASERYAFEKVDICDRAALARVFAAHRPDIVVHLAAESHVDRSIEGPAAFMQTNILGTFTLLEVARDYWEGRPLSSPTFADSSSVALAQDEASVGRKPTGGPEDSERFAGREGFRFLHVSTDEVYGDLGESDAKFTEASPYAPSSPYAASKASADHLVRAWRRTYGLPALITNCSNNYGPYQHAEKLIPRMITNALAGKPLPIYGQGNQVRDWLYVEDHARALHAVATRGTLGATYNIGGGAELPNLEVVRMICTLMEELAPEKPAGVARYADLITSVADRPGHDLRYGMDTEKIRRELAWAPRETFASGLRKTVAWYCRQAV